MGRDYIIKGFIFKTKESLTALSPMCEILKLPKRRVGAGGIYNLKTISFYSLKENFYLEKI